MSLVVEWRQSAPYIKITDVPAAVPEMTLTLERWRIRSEDRVSGVVLAEGEDFETLESEFADLASIEEFSVISRRESLRLYHVLFVSKSQNLPEYSQLSGLVSEIEIRSDGFHVTAYAPDREEVVKGYEFLEGQGMDVEILGLYEARYDSSHSGMSEKQREALFTAYDMGYFDVPKAVTLSEVADELGISQASLSERLKRAQRKLVEAHIRNERLLERFD